jgi:hypothetical protein
LAPNGDSRTLFVTLGGCGRLDVWLRGEPRRHEGPQSDGNIRRHGDVEPHVRSLPDPPRLAGVIAAALLRCLRDGSGCPDPLVRFARRPDLADAGRE